MQLYKKSSYYIFHIEAQCLRSLWSTKIPPWKLLLKVNQIYFCDSTMEVLKPQWTCAINKVKTEMVQNHYKAAFVSEFSNAINKQLTETNNDNHNFMTAFLRGFKKTITLSLEKQKHHTNILIRNHFE